MHSAPQSQAETPTHDAPAPEHCLSRQRSAPAWPVPGASLQVPPTHTVASLPFWSHCVSPTHSGHLPPPPLPAVPPPAPAVPPPPAAPPLPAAPAVPPLPAVPAPPAAPPELVPAPPAVPPELLPPLPLALPVPADPPPSSEEEQPHADARASEARIPRADVKLSCFILPR